MLGKYNIFSEKKFAIKKSFCLNCREQAPISSSLNAVDLYLVVCIFFVFAALIEYAVILLFMKKRRKPRRTIDEGLKTMFRNGESNQGSINRSIKAQVRLGFFLFIIF